MATVSETCTCFRKEYMNGIRRSSRGSARSACGSPAQSQAWAIDFPACSAHLLSARGLPLALSQTLSLPPSLLDQSIWCFVLCIADTVTPSPLEQFLPCLRTVLFCIPFAWGKPAALSLAKPHQVVERLRRQRHSKAVQALFAGKPHAPQATDLVSSYSLGVAGNALLLRQGLP